MSNRTRKTIAKTISRYRTQFDLLQKLEVRAVAHNAPKLPRVPSHRDTRFDMTRDSLFLACRDPNSLRTVML